MPSTNWNSVTRSPARGSCDGRAATGLGNGLRTPGRTQHSELRNPGTSPSPSLNRVLAPIARHGQTGLRHSDFDPTADLLRIRIAGGVAEHVVVARCVVDLAEAAGEVVGLADASAARLVGEDP